MTLESYHTNKFRKTTAVPMGEWGSERGCGGARCSSQSDQVVSAASDTLGQRAGQSMVQRWAPAISAPPLHRRRPCSNRAQIVHRRRVCTLHRRTAPSVAAVWPACIVFGRVWCGVQKSRVFLLFKRVLTTEVST